MHQTEQEIWNLLRSLAKIEGGEAATFASAAAENLRRLVATGIFGTALTGNSLELRQVSAKDPAMKEADQVVASLLLSAFDPHAGYAALSKPQIVLRTGFSASKVRLSLSRLVEAGYFVSTQPTEAEWNAGDTALRHRPNFEVLESAK
ncbi:hypothetical protein [Bradyrhizobium sp. RDM4]|uniref:hypothetical protein n=1 Tax=Bradyrhizobium sp. RDM4 TaxID=3378765 RepID=UPI0038FBFE36